MGEEDDRGRHTTTRSKLLILPSGGVLVDTPGLRELAPWTSEEGLEQTFGDIAELAAGWRFRDCCRHGELGCAVLQAAEEGRRKDASAQNAWLRTGSLSGSRPTSAGNPSRIG